MRNIRYLVIAILLFFSFANEKLFSWEAQKESIEFVAQIGHGGIIRHFAFSEESGLVATVDDTTQICLWHREKRRLLRTINASSIHTGRPDNYFTIDEIDIVDDGNAVAVKTNSSPPEVKAWSTITGKPISVRNLGADNANNGCLYQQLKDTNKEIANVTIKKQDFSLQPVLTPGGIKKHLDVRSGDGKKIMRIDHANGFSVWSNGDVFYRAAYLLDDEDQKSKPDPNVLYVANILSGQKSVFGPNLRQYGPPSLGPKGLYSSQQQFVWNFANSESPSIINDGSPSMDYLNDETEQYSDIQYSNDRKWFVVETLDGKAVLYSSLDQSFQHALNAGSSYSFLGSSSFVVLRSDRLANIKHAEFYELIPPNKFHLRQSMAISELVGQIRLSSKHDVLTVADKSWRLGGVPFIAPLDGFDKVSGLHVKEFTFSGDLLAAARSNGDISVHSVAKEFEVVSEINTEWDNDHVQVSDIAFSPRGETIAILADFVNNPLQVWDLPSKKRMEGFEATGQTNWNAITFDKSGQFLLGVGRSREGRVWKVSDGSSIADIIIRSVDHWLVTDATGRFDSSNIENNDFGSWLVADDPLNPLSTDIFSRDYYEPDLLGKLLRGDELPPVRPLQDLNRVQPVVEIVSIERHSDSDKAVIRVKVSGASDEFGVGDKKRTMKTGVYDLRLFRDGQIVSYHPLSAADAALPTIARTEAEREQWRHAAQVCKADETETIEFVVQLPHSRAGEEIEFSAYAFNRDRVKSETAKSKFTIPGDLKKVTPKAFLVGIGVDDYQGNAVSDLNFAAADARLILQDLEPRLKEQGYEIEKTPLVSAEEIEADEQLATKQAIQDTLTGLQDRATPDDLVILSISSHGHTDADSGEFYIFPHDLGASSKPLKELDAREREGFLRDHCVSAEELSVWLRRVDAGELVMIVDTCHAAAALEGKGDFKPGPMGSRGLGQLAYDKGMRILTASQAGDVAIESRNIKQGLLTYALVRDGLEQGQADLDNDKRVTLGEWLQFGERRVPLLFQEVVGGNFKGAKVSDDVRLLTKQADPINDTPVVQRPRLFQYSRDKDGAELVSVPQ